MNKYNSVGQLIERENYSTPWTCPRRWIYAYYESGKMHTEEELHYITRGEDHWWGTYYIDEYSDEDWNGKPYGKLIKRVMGDGRYFVYEDYFEDTNYARYVTQYDEKDDYISKDENNVKGQCIKTVYKYGNYTIHEYPDLFIPHQPPQFTKRFDRDDNIIVCDEYYAEYFGGPLKERTEYWISTGQPKIITSCDVDGNLIEKKYYDINGNLKTMPDDPYLSSFGSWLEDSEKRFGDHALVDMWGLDKINAPFAWDLSTGTDTIVAVLDAGLDYNHPEIAPQLWYNTLEIPDNGIDDDNNGYIDDYLGWDFAGYYGAEPEEDNDVMSTNGQGTYVSGIIAAAENSEGIIGVAPGAKILPVKVLDDGGYGYADILAKGIQYAADMGAKIINISFGGISTASDFLVNAIKNAIDKGCILLAGAGDNWYGRKDLYPANVEGVITVSSLSSWNDELWDFSNYGDKVDICAPGENILTLRAKGTYWDTINPYDWVPMGDPDAEYYRIDGTSMSAAFVSGVAALLASQDKDLTAYDFLRRLKFSSVDLGAAGKDDKYGWGLLDAFNALSYDWYESGNKKTEWLTAPDEDEFTRYDYLDETWQGENRGRTAKKTRQDGSYREYTEYYEDINQARYISDYDTYGNLIETKEYYFSGNLAKLILETPDDLSNKQYEYKDENFDGNNIGRVSRIIKADNSSETYWRYWGDTAQVKIKVIFSEYGYYDTEYHYDAAGEPIIGHEYDTFDPFYYSSNSWGQGYEDMWGWDRIRTAEAWDLSNGEDVIVAVLDTGVDYTHPEIASQLAYNTLEIPNNGIDDDNNGYIDDYLGWDFVGSNMWDFLQDNDVTDGNGHGTFVSGIIAAKNNSVGMAGVAPEAKILPVKVLDDTGSGWLSAIYNGIEYALEMGAKVINMSLAGLGTASAEFIDLIATAIEAGCIFIASSGNECANANNYIPAGMEGVVTVSATTYDDYRAWFSNYGTSVDVAAPGVDILSLRAKGTDIYGDGESLVSDGDSEAEYYWANGTSASAPFVSGVAALLASQDKALTTYDFLRRLEFSSVDLGLSGKDIFYGWGMIDAFSALSYDWYESGNIKTEWFTSPEEGQFTRYDYLDETWQGENCGRIIKKIRQDGSYLEYKEYYESTNQARYISYYDENGNVLETNEYDETSRLIVLYYASGRIHKEFLSDDTEKEYIDENWNDLGRGRLIQVTYSTGTYEKYKDYFEGTNFARFIEKYDKDDNLTEKEEYAETGRLVFTYYPSCRMHKEFLEDGTGNEYSDENWNGAGRGKLIKMTGPFGNYTRYLEYYAGTNQARFEKDYDSENILIEKREYSEIGRLLFMYYASGRIFKEILFDDTIKEYSDEDWNGRTSKGRLIKMTTMFGKYTEYEEHYVNTDQARFEKDKDADGNLLEEREYDEDGKLIKKINYEEGAEYTYYPSERIKTKTLLTDKDDPAGTIYEYSDDSLIRDGTDEEYGYLIKQTFPEETIDGILYKTFHDHYSPDQPRYINEHGENNILQKICEYNENGLIIIFTEP